MGKCLFNLNLKSIFVYFFFICPQLVFSSDQEIYLTLDKLHTTIKEISEKKIDKNNMNYIAQIVSDTYDIKKMSKIILGNSWTLSNPSDRERFVNVFNLYISSNYIDRFHNKKEFDYQYKPFHLNQELCCPIVAFLFDTCRHEAGYELPLKN